MLDSERCEKIGQPKPRVCLRLSPSSSLWGVVSCTGAATSLVPTVSLSPSSTVPVFVYFRLRLFQSSSFSVFVCLRRSARWLVKITSAVCQMFYIKSLETSEARVFTVRAVFRKMGFDTTGELIHKRP